MATIKFNVSANDPLTGKKMKYTNLEIRFQHGVPIEFIGNISLHEINDDPAIPAGSDSRSKRAVESYTENFAIGTRNIDSVTKHYAVNVGGNWFREDLITPIVNPVISLAFHFEQKTINSFPGVANADPLWELAEGLCKEMVNIRQINGELPA